MSRKILALVLAALMLVGIFAGCSKPENGDDPANPGTSTTDKPGQSGKPGQQVSSTEALTAKYAYKTEYLTVDAELQSAMLLCAIGDLVYLSADVIGEVITETDPVTGEEYSYNGYVTGVFTLNLATGEFTQMENFAMPEIPEGWQGNSYFQSLKAAADGTLWANVYWYSYRYNVPEDVDQTSPDFHEWDYYEDGGSGSKFLHLNADGSLIEELSLGEEGRYGDDNVLFDTAGNIYAGSWDKVTVYDKTGKELFSIDMSENGGNLCQLDQDTIGVTLYNWDEQTQTSSRTFQQIDLEAKGLKSEKIELPQQMYNFYPGDDVYDVYYTYNGQNVFGYNFETKTAEKVVDWLEADINSNYLQGYQILPDGRIIACTVDWNSGNGPKVEIAVLTRLDASTLPVKTAITLACQYLDWDLRTKIIEYNKNSDTYRVIVKDYSELADESDTTGGLQKLNVEIMSGKVPDMFLLNNSMPIDRYVGQGVITDLYPFIDNDPELGRDKFVPAILKAAEKDDGKLYELPLTFNVQTAAGLNKVVGEYETWTLADLKDAMTKLDPEATVFSAYVTRGDILRGCISKDLASFIDWQNKEVHFDNENFISLLEFCNSFPETFDWENYDWATEGDEKTQMNSGKQLLTQIGISNFEDFLYQSYGYDSGLKFVGLPSEDGSGRSSFYYNSSFAISAVSPNQDVAWQFLREMIFDQQKQAEDGYLWQMPASKAAFDKMLEKAMTPNYQLDENGDIMYDENGEAIKYPKVSYSAPAVTGGMEGGISVTMGGTSGDEDGMIHIYELSQEDADKILELINSTTAIARYDEEIMKVILDEAEVYFAGAKSAQETAALVQSRVGLYVMEQG